MQTLEETFSPTPLQEASDDTLRSEQRVGKYLPRVLSRIFHRAGVLPRH
jgi:hypothetical protein